MVNNTNQNIKVGDKVFVDGKIREVKALVLNDSAIETYDDYHWDIERKCYTTYFIDEWKPIKITN